MANEPSPNASGLTRYSLWDGSQQPLLDADSIIDALSEDLMEYGDLRWAMRNLMSRGMNMPQGGAMQGLRDLLKQLRDKKRAQLERYNLDNLFDQFRERLAAIEAAERKRIDEWLQGDNPGEDFSNEVFKSVAKRSLETLDALPPELPARIKTLEGYEFLDPDAQRDFF